MCRHKHESLQYRLFYLNRAWLWYHKHKTRHILPLKRMMHEYLTCLHQHLTKGFFSNPIEKLQFYYSHYPQYKVYHLSPALGFPRFAVDRGFCLRWQRLKLIPYFPNQFRRYAPFFSRLLKAHHQDERSWL